MLRLDSGSDARTTQDISGFCRCLATAGASPSHSLADCDGPPDPSVDSDHNTYVPRADANLYSTGQKENAAYPELEVLSG